MKNLISPTITALVLGCVVLVLLHPGGKPFRRAMLLFLAWLGFLALIGGLFHRLASTGCISRDAYLVGIGAYGCLCVITVVFAAVKFIGAEIKGPKNL
jgi:hypothetical protein